MDAHVLSEQNFHHCCQLLLQQSEQLKDGWTWETIQDSEEGYLKKTELRSVIIDSGQVWDHEGSNSETEPSTSCDSMPDQQKDEQVEDFSDFIVPVDVDCITGDMDGDDEDDWVCTVSEGSRKVLQYEYHVLYSCSYSTPVLYFRASTLEGRSLTLEEVWSSVHPAFRLRLQKSPLSTISLQEHPLLAQTFFMLHPCKTEEFMSPVLKMAQNQQRPVNYVLTWLSVVGPVVGLEVPLKYSTGLHGSSVIRSTTPE